MIWTESIIDSFMCLFWNPVSINLMLNFSGLVHCHICLGYLSFEPIAGLLDAQNWSSISAVGSRGSRWWSWTASQTKWRVPTFHSSTSRVQILVFSNESHSDRILLYVFRVLQYSSLLAHPCNVFHYPLLHYDETSNKGMNWLYHYLWIMRW